MPSSTPDSPKTRRSRLSVRTTSTTPATPPPTPKLPDRPSPPQPDPARGRLIRYDYLWAREFGKHLRNGLKTRKCLIWSVEPHLSGFVVDALPLSTSSTSGVVLTDGECAKLGLDLGARIIVDEANRFTWLGPDLEIQADGSFYVGVITRKIADRVTAALGGHIPATIINRDER